MHVRSTFNVVAYIVIDCVKTTYVLIQPCKRSSDLKAHVVSVTFIGVSIRKLITTFTPPSNGVE
jgi:hypothetical protein